MGRFLLSQSATERTSMTSADPWFSLSMDALNLTLEAQSVIGLRMMKAAGRHCGVGTRPA